MNTQLEIEEARTKLDRMGLRVKQMVLDAKKTGLELEVKKRRVISDLEQRLGRAKDRLQSLQRATADQAEHAAREFQKAWDDVKEHADRATQPPGD